MNELIKIEAHETLMQAVNARDLHAFLDVKTDFKNWIVRRIEEYGFIEESDFRSFLTESTGGRPAREYAISIDMAKELSMVERNEKGREARQYFIECEHRLTSAQFPQTYIAALEAFLNSEKEKLRIEAEKQALALQFACKEQEALELRVALDCEFGYCSILRAAKFLGLPETVFDWRVLKAKSIRIGKPPIRVPSPRYPYQLVYPLEAFVDCYPGFNFNGLDPEQIENVFELANPAPKLALVKE